MSNRTLSFVIVLFLFLIGAATLSAESVSLIELNKLNKQQYLEVARMGLDIIERHESSLLVVGWPRDLEKLESAAIPYEVKVGDLSKMYSSRNSASATMGGYMTFSEIVDQLDLLSLFYPWIMTTKFSIGQTVEGREQWVVKISDNPNVDEDEPELFYISLIHAREPNGASALLYFMEYLLANYGTNSEVTDIVDNREIYFLAVQNPDGYVYNETTDPSGGGMWRKNRRDNGGGIYGVDLNRNYGYKWGYNDLGSSGDSTSETYRGPGPFSEPETQNVRDFVLSRNFTIIRNFHTYSNLELWPWGYDRYLTDKEEFYQNAGDSMTMFNAYTPGAGWRLYPTNGESDDWAWGDTLTKPRIISFTCEIGNSVDGFWPDPSRIATLNSENLWPNLFLARIADNPYIIGPPDLPNTTAPPTSTGNYVVNWSTLDTVNTPVAWEVEECSDQQIVTDDAEADYGYWELDRMALSSTRAYSGTFSWHSVNGNRAAHMLTSNGTYEVQANDSLSYMIWFDIEQGWDYFYTQVSTDNGLSYESIPNNFTTNDDPNGQNAGNGVTGTSGGNWVEAQFDLSAYEGERIKIRLAYFTDDWIVNEGIYIDDFNKVELFDTKVQLAAATADDSISIAAQPEGDFWYHVRGTDAQGQVSHWSNLAKVTVSASTGCCLADRGNVNDDLEDKVNISDVTFLVDYLFGIPAGAAPACLEEGNVNGDPEEKINVSDVTYLIAYLFNVPSGPAPPACP